ncbi:sigma-70 family RNA polymerase sigma factor [Roseateles sp. DAIF2]|uniref:sigma-70 family RNA polymerase sigma factor n=1 Tax=Roseateles sp. DAIF2 TaxID=2714952 RepID=UPI0018A2EB48|nr:sigma-70 family RNA polymerase sigma factor [Roseateles sp. DAIF2]QPF75694.1 sigma-70 family RNA polymerase sigma factor [Roseateles sp. DAIF2]
MSALLLGFEQSYQSLLRFLTRRTGCAETARELAHETWLRVAEAAPGHGEGGVPEQQRAYLYTVAQNLALDHLRRQARGGERFVDAEAAPPQDLAPDDVDLERSLALRQAVQAVEGGLGGLPPRVRETFLAHRLEGLGHEELAARHGVSVKTIERDMGQAMDAVHQALLRWRGEPRAPRRRRQALSGLLGGGALLLAGGLGWRHWRAERSDAELAAAAGPVLAERRLATRPAQLLDQRLPDGSELRLDADSELQWRWHAGLRQARLLRGAAYFSVRPDAERPFVVWAGEHSVRVLGTAFALELDGPRLLVAVEHGRVRVSGGAAGGQRELVGGEQLALLAGQDPAGAGPTQRTQGVAPWREGWLEFQERPLDEVLRRLSRYLPRPLSWSPAAGRQRVSARVHLAHLQEWLRLLPDSHGLALQVQPGGAWRLQLRDE